MNTTKSLMSIACSALFVVVLFSCNIFSAQEISPSTPDNLAIARDFLHAMYPHLDGRNYFLSLQTILYYDKQSDPFGGWLQLSIGEGPKDQVLYSVNGCQALPVTPQHAAPNEPPPVLTTGDCKPGPVTPKQLLSAGFHFGEKGHFLQFQASGPATGDPLSKAEYAKLLMGSKKKLTGAELIAAFRRVGAKYGPDDKDAFVKSLPLTKLEPFLGKLKVVSVEFAPFSEEDRSDFNDEMDWEVKTLATRHDGTTATYRLRFEQYRGDLVAFGDTSTYPWNLLDINSKDKP